MPKGSLNMPASFGEDLNLVRKQLAYGEADDIDADSKAMFRQLSRPAIAELGIAVTNSNHLTYRRAARCPASHNRLLLGGLDDESPAERARLSGRRDRSRQVRASGAGAARETQSSNA